MFSLPTGAWGYTLKEKIWILPPPQQPSAVNSSSVGVGDHEPLHLQCTAILTKPPIENQVLWYHLILKVADRTSTVTIPTANAETENQKGWVPYSRTEAKIPCQKNSPQRPSSEPNYMLHCETNWLQMQISHLLLCVFLHSWIPCLQDRYINCFPSRVLWSLTS